MYITVVSNNQTGGVRQYCDNLRDWRVGDPRLAPVKNEPTVCFLGSSLHASRVRAMIGFGESLE